MSMKPITSICLISKRSDCPSGYTMLDRTTSGDDADLWRDKLFRSKVKRYLCYTREDLSNKGEVINDITLIDAKEPILPGYTSIDETHNSGEEALHKQRLCVRKVPRSLATTAVSDVKLCKNDGYRSEMYTLAGETNGIKIAFKVTTVSPQPAPRRTAPPPPAHLTNSRLDQASASSSQTARAAPKAYDVTSPSCLDGIPFKLNDKIKASASSMARIDLSGVVYQSPAELLESTKYDFSKERNLLF